MRAKNTGQVTIGVFGLHPGAGATHLTILLATFLSHYRKKKVIVIEKSGKNAFRYFEEFLYGAEGSAEEFGSRRCRYQKGFGSGKETMAAGQAMAARQSMATRQAMATGQSMAAKQAECLLYDLGCNYAAAGQLLDCDVKWVIGSSGIFHAKDWESFLEKKEVREEILLRGADQWHFLQNHAITGKQKKFFSGHDAWKKRLEIYGLGSEENLLHLSREAIGLFSRMGI